MDADFSEILGFNTPINKDLFIDKIKFIQKKNKFVKKNCFIKTSLYPILNIELKLKNNIKKDKLEIRLLILM